LVASERFGTAIAVLGDLDNDGVDDIAVASRNDHGAVYVLLMNADRTVKSQVKIGDGTPGGLTPGSLAIAGGVGNSRFGYSIGALGDLDGDGVPDMAVGAIGNGNGEPNEGSVFVLMMHADGTERAS